MIDHVYISVTDIDKSLAFYSETLKPLGWSVFGNYDSASGPDGVPDLYGIGDDVYGKGKAVGSSIWLRQRKPGETGLYLGIVCDTNELVDAAYAAAIKAGGIDGGNQQIVPTSPPAITPPTSPTSTATVLSSCKSVEPQATLKAILLIQVCRRYSYKLWTILHRINGCFAEVRLTETGRSQASPLGPEVASSR